MSNEEIREYIEILDMLKVELNAFKMMGGEIIKNHNEFEKITENYVKYHNLINKGKSHLSDLEKRELYIIYMFIFDTFFSLVLLYLYYIKDFLYIK